MFCAVIAVTLSAAAVWEEKPFMQWSDKDIDKLLTDSPWAGKATLTHEREGANLPPIDLKLTVVIRSAEPIRRAVARQQLAAGLPAAPDLEANLSKPYPRYAFAIPKIPQMYRMGLTKTAQGAVLKVKGQELMAVDAGVQLLDKNGKEVAPPPARGPAPTPQASAGVQIIPVVQRGGGGGGFGGGGGVGGGGFGGGFKDDGTTATLILEYPRVEGLSAADGEVEISMILGGYKVRKTFKLKEMTFKGALAF